VQYSMLIINLLCVLFSGLAGGLTTVEGTCSDSESTNNIIIIASHNIRCDKINSQFIHHKVVFFLISHAGKQSIEISREL
jgi:hypothetical protein